MAKVVMPDLSTGNSLKNRQEEEKKAVPKVTKGAVRTSNKRKSGFFDAFFEDDIQDIKTYVISDVIIPAFKNLIFDSFVGSIEMALFGTTNRSRRGGSNGQSNSHYVSYNKFSGNNNNSSRSSRSSDRLNYQSVVFEERADAEEVLDTLNALIEDYGQASIGDFYDAAGITPDNDFAKNEEYGWYDLHTARVQRTREGYIISMPREKYLN